MWFTLIQYGVLIVCAKVFFCSRALLKTEEFQKYSKQLDFIKFIKSASVFVYCIVFILSVLSSEVNAIFLLTSTVVFANIHYFFSLLFTGAYCTVHYEIKDKKQTEDKPAEVSNSADCTPPQEEHPVGYEWWHPGNGHALIDYSIPQILRSAGNESEYKKYPLYYKLEKDGTRKEVKPNGH